jgi:AsmA family protein
MNYLSRNEERSAMKTFLNTHRKMKWGILCIAGLLIAILLFLAFIDGNVLKPMVARAVSARTGRHAVIAGDLKLRLFSLTPSAEINGLSLTNPPWAEKPLMFEAKQVALSVSLGRLLRGQVVIPQIKVVEPVINLERDAQGRASWNFESAAGTPKGSTNPAKIPTIRSLLIQNGQLQVLDHIRKLRFGGSLVADEQSGQDDPSAFKVRAKGTLNEKPFSLDASGGPLLNLAPEKPYSFTTHVSAADIKLESHVTVLKPFDLSLLEVSFVVGGKDLADLYYLTGLALPNTATYRLAARVHVSGTTFRAENLSGRVGSSDLEGSVLVEVGGKRPKLTGKLMSRSLNLVDLAPSLGQPAEAADTLSGPKVPNGKKSSKRSQETAQRSGEPAPKAAEWVLPDADLQVERVRGMDADVTYEAASVRAPKLHTTKVDFHLVLNDGVLSLDPLRFVLDQGTFSGTVRIDARSEVPESSLDMRIADVDLSQFKTAKMTEAPLSGLLMGRFKIQGTGGSIHKFASTADGAISLIIPDGKINEAMAELTGINVTQGIGLLLTKKDTQTPIRCSVIDFQAQNGMLNAKNFFLDTTDVLITGRGSVHLGDERLDLAVQGNPKTIRFTRIRAPITVKGTLAHPAIGVDAGKLAKQGAVATALGTLLTPFAAIIAFIDPGHPKNKDCAASFSAVSAPVSMAQ